MRARAHQLAINAIMVLSLGGCRCKSEPLTATREKRPLPPQQVQVYRPDGGQ